MKGVDTIPSLHLVTLTKVVREIPTPPNLFFSNMFPSTNYPSDSIEWEVTYGSSGMAPIIAPGAKGPKIGIDGLGRATAQAAFMKELMYFDESFLNNLREPGTHDKKMMAQKQLANGLRKLTYRNMRRKEWMFAKMLTDGEISYSGESKGVKFSVDYGIPTNHKVTLADSDKWGTGTNRNPVEDIMDAKIALSEDAMVNPNWTIMNTTTLKLLMFDASLQALLSKSAFGDGDLFNPARTTQVLASLLGISAIYIYDELYEVESYLTSAVTADSTTDIYVEDARDFEVGGKLRFVDSSERNSWEDETISAVDLDNNKITVSTAPSTSYKAVEDKVVMKRKFVADNKVMMLSTTAEGVPISEYMQAPFSLPAGYGRKADSQAQWEPEGVDIRVQDKGLPVLYYPEAIYTMTVA